MKHRARGRVAAAAVLVAFCAAGLTAVPARDVVPDVPLNKAWDVDESSATYTGGGRGPATIQLALAKAGVSGRPLSVETDGDYVLLSDDTAGDVRVAFPLPRKPAAAPDAPADDGTVSTLELVGGDHPTVGFGGHDSVRENGRWRRIVRAPGPTVTLTLTNATFAVVKFVPPAAPTPPPPPMPPVPATPGPVGRPRPLPPPLKPVRLQVATRNFADAVSRPCSTCNGTGHVSVQVQVGVSHQGAFAVPIMQTQQQPCGRCAGTGALHADPAVILARAGELVHDLIAVDMSDPTAQDVVKATYATVTTNAVGNRRCWDVLTKDARSTLSLAQPRVGTPLIAEVIVDSNLVGPDGRRGFHAHLPGTTNEFVIDDPPAADNVAAGPVLMGGLIDHVVPGGPHGPPTAVVRGAFLVSPDIDRRWTWWISH